MIRSLHLLALSVALLALPGSAAAVSLLNDAREVFSSYRQNTDGATPFPDFSNFSGAVSALGGNSAEQTSLISLPLFAGSGSAASADPSEGYAYSHFSVIFTLETPTPYSLEGALGDSFGNAESLLRLQGDPIDDGPIWFSASGGDGERSFSDAGVLPAGEHGLIVSALVFPDASPQSAHWQFAFSLGGPGGPAVPEPGSGALFATGSALFAAAASRRRRRAPERIR